MQIAVKIPVMPDITPEQPDIGDAKNSNQGHAALLEAASQRRN